MLCPICHREFEPDLPDAMHRSVHHYPCPGCATNLHVTCIVFRSPLKNWRDVRREFVLIGPASRGRLS